MELHMDLRSRGDGRVRFISADLLLLWEVHPEIFHFTPAQGLSEACVSIRAVQNRLVPNPASSYS